MRVSWRSRSVPIEACSASIATRGEVPVHDPTIQRIESRQFRRGLERIVVRLRSLETALHVHATSLGCLDESHAVLVRGSRVSLRGVSTDWRSTWSKLPLGPAPQAPNLPAMLTLWARGEREAAWAAMGELLRDERAT